MLWKVTHVHGDAGLVTRVFEAASLVNLSDLLRLAGISEANIVAIERVPRQVY